MSIRGLWIINPKTSQKLVFSRRFLTVEQQAKQIYGEQYQAIPPDAEWVSLVSSCFPQPTYDEFLPERHSCVKIEEPPVWEVPGGYWPVVGLLRHALLFCCVPLVETTGTPEHRPPYIELPSITVGFEFLEQLAAFIGEDGKSYEPTDTRICELHSIVSMAMPFGTPIHFQLSTASALLQARPPAPSQKDKQMAWKPFPHKGGSRLSLAVQERIRAAQYDRSDVTNVWQVTGSVRCKAELEGVPEVSVSVGVPPNGHPLHYLLVHPCVLSSEAHPNKAALSPVSSGGNLTQQRVRRLTFSPPHEQFDVCQYEAKNVPLPVRGFYQMKGDKTIKLLVQLKLAEHVKNSFDFCELRLPFFHRGMISNVEYLPNSAQVSVAPDQRTLVWSIGQKFPSRSLEVSLNATISFSDSNGVAVENGKEDTFCVGLNAYADLNFKILDYTASGCYVDSKTVSLYPNIRYHKLICTRELVSDTYRIWNSHGDARMVYTP